MKTRNDLKTALMMTVASATFAGFTAIAAAQTTQNPSGSGAATPQGATPQGAQQEQKGGAPGGASTLHQQGGTSTLHQQSGAQQDEKSPSGQSAQESAKPGQRMDQNSAQGERGTEQKGAQTERGKAGITSGPERNAQGSTHGGATSHGKSVQLSRDQRSRIGTIIGKTSSARVNGKPDFDVTVGATVPRSVHVVALPADVVQVVPEYEGYDYILVGDQILIVDPDSMEIVAVVEA